MLMKKRRVCTWSAAQLAKVLFLPLLSVLAPSLSSFPSQPFFFRSTVRHNHSFFPTQPRHNHSLSSNPFQGGSLPFSKFEFLVMWLFRYLTFMLWTLREAWPIISIIFRECGAPYLFLHALSHPSIRWRTHEFRLQWGGRAEPVLGVVKKEKEVFAKAHEVNHDIKLAIGSENSEIAELASSRLIS